MSRDVEIKQDGTQVEDAARYIDFVGLTVEAAPDNGVTVTGGGGSFSGAASDVTVSPEVAGASDVQGALEGLAAGEVRTLDLGSVLATDLLSGRVVIYTAADGEYIKAISYGLDTVLPDAAFVIFETPSRQSEGLSYAKAMVGPSPTPDAYNAFDSPAGMMGLAVGGGQPFYTPLDPGPLTASLCWNGIISDETAERGHVLETPGWEADHIYVATVEVIQSAHIWANDGGTSGGSLPDFAGNIGGTVSDNGITWTDKADVPTEGSVHVYVDVVTP